MKPRSRPLSSTRTPSRPSSRPGARLASAALAGLAGRRIRAEQVKKRRRRGHCGEARSHDDRACCCRKPIRTHDAADALAIAVCHAHHAERGAQGGGAMIASSRHHRFLRRDSNVLDVGGVATRALLAARCRLPGTGQPATLSIEDAVPKINQAVVRHRLERDGSVAADVQGRRQGRALGAQPLQPRFASAIACATRHCRRAPRLAPRSPSASSPNEGQGRPIRLDPAVIRLSGRRGQARAAPVADAVGAGQSRLRSAAGRAQSRRRAQRRRGADAARRSTWTEELSKEGSRRAPC